MGNLGRTIRTIFILVAVIVALAVVVGQVLKGVVNYEDTTSVLIYSSDFAKGEQIKSSNVADFVKTIKVPKGDVPPTAIKSTDDLKEQYINEDVFKGEYVTQNTISADYPFHVSYDIPDGYSLVSVKFDRGDSANAWNVFDGQEIQLVYTPNTMSMANANVQYLTERLINCTIYSIKDSQFYVKGELDYNPTKLLYITFLVNDKDAVFISHIKEMGRLDIIQ